ncbi:MAG: flagellar export chaperone FliS [bacterium]
MAIVSPYQQYETTKILTSTPLDRIILLYRKSIRLLEEAVEGIKDNDVLLFSEDISKACKIIEYLLSVLDMENGKEISENLSRLYDYFIYTLTVSNMSRDVTGVERVKNLLEGLLSGWEKVKELE